MARRARAVARFTVKLTGAGLVFVAATAAGVLFHLDRPAGRRLVQRTVNGALSPVLRGTITIEKIDRIAILSGRVEGVDATVRDPAGAVVVVVRGISARISVGRMLRSLV